MFTRISAFIVPGMIPISSLGSVRHIDLWRCEQCGITRPATWRNPQGRLYHERSKYCGGTCRGNAMRGKANPAYTTGNRSQIRADRKYECMRQWQVEAIQSWDAGGRIVPIQRVAEVVGVTKRAIWKRLASIKRRCYDGLQVTGE